MKQILLVFTLFLLTGVTLHAEPCQKEGIGTPSPVRLANQTVAILTPATALPTPAIVSRWLEESQHIRKQRSAPKEANRTQKFDRLQKGKRESAPQEPPPTDREMLHLAYLVFSRVLESRLKANFDSQVLTTEQILTLAKRERIEPEGLATESGAKTLSRSLQGVPVLWLERAEFVVRDGSQRVLTFRAVVRRTGAEAQGGSERVSEEPICGVAVAERSVLSGAFSRSLPSLMIATVTQATKRYEHTLRTGGAMPLIAPETRIAVFPVFAPTQADRLLFTPIGRQLQHNAIGNLPNEVTALFQPNLLPLSTSNCVRSEAIKRILKDSQIYFDSFWNREGGLNRVVVQSIGRQLSVSYLLVAHISKIEINGTLSSKKETIERALLQEDVEGNTIFQATVEAVCVLARVKDGVVLWQERAEVTLGVRGDQPRTRHLPTEQETIHDASRFSLIRLEQSLARYFASFEN